MVIGNSGVGKSWLAERIAHRTGGDWVDLDGIHWMDDSYGVARSADAALVQLRQATQAERWVVEGIYGDLIRAVAPHAAALIWLCLDEDECVASIRARGVRHNGNERNLEALIQWAQSYRTRTGSSSYRAHELLFNEFAGDRVCLRSRSDVARFATENGITPIS